MFLKFYGIFDENFEKNLENLEICICKMLGGGALRHLRIYGDLSRKINGNLQVL